jgi:hypothetical protein
VCTESKGNEEPVADVNRGPGLESAFKRYHRATMRTEGSTSRKRKQLGDRGLRGRRRNEREKRTLLSLGQL